MHVRHVPGKALVESLSAKLTGRLAQGAWIRYVRCAMECCVAAEAMSSGANCSAVARPRNE